MINDAWQGSVQFYELVFGTWLIYAFLVILWERVLRQPLAEWRYVLLVFLGASFFWVNHYFQHAPFYFWLLNGYTLICWIGWWSVGVYPHAGSLVWKVAATLSFILFTVAFIAFEQVARFGNRRGIHEFWFMLIAYFGIAGLILWRRRAGERRAATAKA
jgi:hypothetical protein